MSSKSKFAIRLSENFIFEGITSELNNSKIYKCRVWAKLILKSLDNMLENNIIRQIRKELLEHPLICEHQNCKEIAKQMRILK